MAAESDRRQAQMSIDLGGEQVLLERVRCTEALGEPFELSLDIIAALGEIDLLPHLGKPATAHVYEDDELMRHFSGFITDGEFVRESGAGFHYRLTARPFTWFLSHNRDMAIFQDLSVPDIINKVFNDAGQTNFRLKLSKSYGPRVYCVQYRESDWTFLTRLMEEEGIYYFFEHDADKHTMILCDAPSAHEAGTPTSLRYSTTARSVLRAGSGQRGGDRHYLEKLGERVSSQGESQVTLRSFNFEKPERPLQAQAQEPGQHPGDRAEVYDYHAAYLDEGRGAALSQVRLAGIRRNRQVYSGRTQATSLRSGTKLSVTDHPAGRFNQAYLLTRTYHSIANEAYRAEHHEPHEDDEETHVSFEAIPADTLFHSPQVTPRPIVQGIESAIVTGPAGEEIYTDEFGRVKVRFHWDRSGTPGEKATCWIRIAQFGGLGNVIIPRRDQEVFVDFLEGNPDKPVIVGVGFNKTHMPIYPLPANKTRAVWRTGTYGASGSYPDAKPLDSGAPRANEIRFEDKGGQEEMYVHAERDMNTRVRFQETHHVGQTQTKMVGLDRKLDVGRDHASTTGRDRTDTITRNRKVDVTGTDELTVHKTLKVTATTSITLTCGASTITMTPSGITVQTPHFKVQGSATAIVTAPQTLLRGTGNAWLKGGLVQIN